MNYVQLLEDVKNEVTRFFYAHEKASFTYHNLLHTESVVLNASQIARHYTLADRDFFVVATAAWFHDIGYYIDNGANHEMKGAEMADTFLQKRKLDAETIKAVHDCIMATQMPQAPHSLLEQIVCDADLFHLGTDSFTDLNKRMRKEAEWRFDKSISKHDWRKGTLQLLETHHYHTDYARTLLQAKKLANIERLKHKEYGDEIPEAVQTQPLGTVENSIGAALPEIITGKQKKQDRPDRGIETMFRISSGNHQRLSDMADNKAHIMITTTSIIISVLLSVLLRKLEDNPNLLIPTVMLLAICVITMVFCILATRPALPGGTFTQKDIEEKKVNLLFFGNFYRMNFEEYSGGMHEMMKDREFLYGSLIRDLYSQGIVLGRKYHLLRFGYNVFMFGIVASVIAFLIATIFFNH